MANGWRDAKKNLHKRTCDAKGQRTHTSVREELKLRSYNEYAPAAPYKELSGVAVLAGPRGDSAARSERAPYGVACHEVAFAEAFDLGVVSAERKGG